jgi:hypothetical protein
MKRLLLQSLAPLASKVTQEKYIVHGTKDEYRLPSELLEQAASVCARALSTKETDLSPQDVEAVRQFDVVLKWELKDFNVESYTNAELIRSCPEWAEVTEAAGICLSALGFKSELWEQSDA